MADPHHSSTGASESEHAAEVSSAAVTAPSSHQQGQHLQRHGEQPRKLRILVLVGLIGSGKSTFAKSLSKYDPSYVRSSQDVLGSRQAVESHVLSLLSRGINPIVDRTNVSVDQRSNWLRLALQWQDGQRSKKSTAVGCIDGNAADGGDTSAKEVPDVEVDAIYFDTGPAECTRRLMSRTEHETIHSPEQALRVLNAFSSELRAPTLAEGFHKILVVTPADLPCAEVSSEDVRRLLQRLEDLPAAYGGGTKGPLLGGRHPVGRGTGAGGSARGVGRNGGGKLYGWGALDRGRGGGRGISSTGRGGNSRGREGREQVQLQQTLHLAWGGDRPLPPAPPSLPPRPT